MSTELCVPNPEFLIKSISEQGYSLETSIADLIDNSISADAKRVEVLIDTQIMPFQLFISDDGQGMTSEELKKNMQFPSSSPEKCRETSDLGRFGLGLKTASFAQSRCFTVITKKPDDKKYAARTWDVNHLKKTGEWEVIVNSEEEINGYLLAYNRLSRGFLNSFIHFSPNTIIVWHGLYKFEKDIDSEDQSSILQKELTDTTKEYLQLIFHRFMERTIPLKIRVNNEQLIPFNPFPPKSRQISTRQKSLLGNKLKLEGFVLPNNSIAESKGISEWTLTHKSLMDMEGMYIYRADRIIVFGGWNGVIKKSPRLQLARLKVEVGNGIDHLFHLNVAKSSIIIPYRERVGFIRYVSELKTEAEKEFFNFSERGPAVRSVVKTVFKKIPTSQGISLAIDEEFPLLSALIETLNEEQKSQLKIILRIITTSVNKIKKVHADETYTSVIERNSIQENEVKEAIKLLLAGGISKNNILSEVILAMGIDVHSLPSPILSLLQ
jgi:hypothetical protein